MQVQNIECQIARAQLGRYIAGDGMASEAVTQLEAHIAKCPDCKAIMQAKQKDLEAAVTAASISHPAPDANPFRISDTRSSASRLAQALISKAAVIEAAQQTHPAPQPSPVQPQV